MNGQEQRKVTLRAGLFGWQDVGEPILLIGLITGEEEAQLAVDVYDCLSGEIWDGEIEGDLMGEVRRREMRGIMIKVRKRVYGGDWLRRTFGGRYSRAEDAGRELGRKGMLEIIRRLSGFISREE